MGFEILVLKLENIKTVFFVIVFINYVLMYLLYNGSAT